MISDQLQRRTERAKAEIVAHAEQTRLPELILGVALVGTGYPLPGVPVSLPVTYAAILVAIALATCRRAPLRLSPVSKAVLCICLAAMCLPVIASLVNHVEAGVWLRRELRLFSGLVFAFFLASGRIHFPSVLRGFVLGLLLNALLFYAGVAPADYGHFLTGFLQDKNQAGLAIALAGVLGLQLFKTARWQALWLAVSAAMLWATGSRTSLAAFAVAITWYFLAPYLRGGIRLGLMGAIVAGVLWAESHISRIGSFSDRGDTDWFRERIDEATQAKLASSSWWGEGLGQAFVNISNSGADDDLFFFHSSYSTLLIEGGYLYFVLIIAATLLPAFGRDLFSGKRGQQLIAQAACLVILVCAWKLGEVFLTYAWSLALGYGLWVSNQSVAEGVQEDLPMQRSDIHG